MGDQFSRTKLLIGEEGAARLASSRVAVFGIGGVGSYAAEALVRCGLGAIDLIDNDVVCLSNLNRQLFATLHSVGQLKTEAAKERLLSINPQALITTRNTFFLPETADRFNFSQYDYVVDAIDTVTGKLELAVRCNEAGTPLISAMGAGNKLDAAAFRVADICQTKMCPLARVMRKELGKRGVERLKVVYSEEPPIKLNQRDDQRSEDADLHTNRDSEETNLSLTDNQQKDEPCGLGRRQIPGSISFVPPVVGMIIAGEVVKDIIGIN